VHEQKKQIYCREVGAQGEGSERHEYIDSEGGGLWGQPWGVLLAKGGALGSTRLDRILDRVGADPLPGTGGLPWDVGSHRDIKIH